MKTNALATPAALDALRILMECMEQVPPLSVEALNVLRRKQEERIERMLQSGETWNNASSGPAFLSLDEASFRSRMRSIDNDLGEQVAIVSQSFARYLEIGEIPAPYYPWRVAIVLRRAGQPALEKRFLGAWCRHFPKGNGGRYADLVERFKKLSGMVAS